MRANIAVFARTAELDPHGALIRLEHPFNFHHAAEFPARLEGLKLVLDLLFEPSDYAVGQQISIRIVDPDGEVIATLTSTPLNFTSPHAGYPVSFCQVVPLTVHFPREGTYSFEILANDQRITEVPLYIGKPPLENAIVRP
jgi:hypothetical protein